MSHDTPLKELLMLSHELGREERKLAILGEGNTSASTPQDTLLVKASGSKLATLGAEDVTECSFDGLAKLIQADAMSDEAIDQVLLDSRTSEESKKPSVEAAFHAYLLSLPEVSFVGHTHPVAVNGLLCSEHAGTFAKHRLCPDEVVCCGTESVLVPYTDPGVKLAQAIRIRVEEFIERTSRAPRVVLLENHGMIALGAKPEAVIAATLMTVKAAEIYATACAISKQPRFLTSEQVERIAGRPDEHYRQQALGL